MTAEREAELRERLADLNPEATPEEIDSIDLAIYDCGGCS